MAAAADGSLHLLLFLLRRALGADLCHAALPKLRAACSNAQRHAAYQRAPPRGLFRRLVKPKTDGKKKAPEEWQAPPDYLRAAARMGAPEEEFPGERLALEASFNEVLPAPDDVAEEWSARMYVEEEVERQRRILEELERERAAATGGRRIPPPPPPPEYYILDPSDEDEDAPTAPGPSRWHGGDAGEGPSNAAGSGSDDDDDDGGDYTVFYSQLGM